MAPAAPLPVTAPTFLVLAARIAADESLPAWRRKSVATSIRCFTRLLRLDPATTPVDLHSYQRALARFQPRRAGIDKRRWENIVGDIRFALRYAGVEGVPGRSLTPLAPQWATLMDRVGDRGIRYRVSRFARWCSQRGIEPGQVSASTLEEFRVALESSVIGLKKATHTWRLFLKAWNTAASKVAGWPHATLELGPNPRRWTPELHTLPCSLQEDINSYLAWASRRDPLADDAPVRVLKATTLTGRRYEIRAFLGALLATGGDPQELRTLADLVAPNTAKAGLRYLVGRSAVGSTLRAYKVACSLKLIARDWVKAPPEQLEQLTRICRRLAPKAAGMTMKNRERLRAFDDRRNVSAIVHLPHDLLRHARRHDEGLRKTAVHVQLAVAIELLLMTALRIGNLTRLHLEENLSWSRAARSGVVHVIVPEADVKNGEPLEFELLPDSAHLLHVYLDQFRPRLLEAPNAWLFPGRGGRAKHDRVLAKQISDRIREHTGLDVHPHLFRHLGAKLHLDANPGQYELVRRVLGHRRLDTTVGFYAGSETAAAVRHFDAQILKLRASAPALRPRLR